MAETRAEETTRAATEPDTEESSRGAILSVLRIPSFRWLIADNAFGATGFQAITMVQAWVVLELTDSDAWVGAVNGLPAIPAAGVVLFAGVMADRIDRRILLVWGRIAMAVIGLAMGLLVAAGVVSAWQLLLLATVFTIARVVAVVASQTLVVDVVGRKRLFIGNAVYGTTFNLAFFAGPAIGGLLIAEFGSDTAFLAAGLVLVIAAGAAFFIRIPPRDPTPRESSVMDDLRAGIAYVRKDPALRWLAAMAMFLMFAGVYFPMVPRIARDSLGVEAGGYGSILAAQGVGAFAGTAALLASGNLRAIGRILLIASLVFSALLVAFAYVNSLAMAWIVAFGIGAVIPWWANTLRTAFQIPTSDEMRGRVMALFALATQAILFGWLIGGVASELIGPRATLISAGAITSTFYVFVYAKSSAIRQLGRE